MKQDFTRLIWSLFTPRLLICRSDKKHSGLFADDIFFNCVDDVADIVIGNVGTCWKADTNSEEGFAHAVGVSRGVFVDRLFVHRFPQWTGFDVSSIQNDAKGFDVGVWLAVGYGCLCCVSHAGSAANGSSDYFFIGVLLSFDFQIGIEGRCTKPII